MDLADYKEITKESYQSTAAEYAHKVMELAPISSIERFINLLPQEPQIIDIGCGSGRDAKIFSEKGARVLGIDFCPNLLEIARASAPLAQFQLMDIESMAFPASSFDGAWAACSLTHIPKKNFPDVIKRVHDLLKDGGYFYLTLKLGSGEALEQDSRYDGDVKKFCSYFEEDEIKDILNKAGFNIIDFALVEKNHSYQSHSALRFFCQKV